MRPIIKSEEFNERKIKVQNMMMIKNIDLIVAYSDDRFVFGQAHARWLINYQPQFEPALILVPKVGEIFTITGAESYAYVLLTSYCKQVRVTSDFLHPDEEYPGADIVSFDKVVKELEDQIGHKITNIGLAGGEQITIRLYDMLISKFKLKNISDIEPALMKIRAIKTKAEIEVIKYAFSIAEKGISAAYNAIEEGKTERDIAAEAEYIMRKSGSEGTGIELMVSSGIKNTAPVLSKTTFRKIQNNDLISLTFAVRYEGYHGPISRPIVLGKPSDEVKRAIELSIRAQEETRAILKPGVTGSEVDKVSRRLLNESGLGSHFVYTGVHSTGVVEFEPPILGSDSEEVLKENMVFAIDIPLFYNTWGGMRIENGFQIVKDGCIPLNSLEVKYIK